jgi:short-subunit dehydrogenase
MKRIIIVTGASSGLGWEFSLQLSKARTAEEIWLIARRKDRLENLAAEITRAGGPTPRVIELDLDGKKGVDHFTALLEKEADSTGKDGFIIDTLVNNAGFGTYGTFTDTTIDRELEMINLNVYALTGLCHAALPRMQKGSLIINVASLAAFIPLGNFAVYGATKAYVLSFSTALAAEVADSGIFVETVCPGPVDTEFANVASNGAREKVIDGKSPKKVVEHCLKNVRRGRRLAVMAPKWKFKAFMSRFVGRYSFARFTYIHDKRPSK